MIPPPELENALLHRGGKKIGSSISFRCPYPDQHENGDAHPSANFHLEKNVWYCHVCCRGGGWKELCELFGLTMKNAPRAEIAARYLYQDEDGTELRRKLRWEPGFSGSKKSFSWQKPDGNGGWTKCSGDGNPKKLYGSEKLPLAREQNGAIFVVEGEKDVDSGTALGICAVCNPEGAAAERQRSKWKKSYSRQLKDLSVTIIADKDKPGRAHAAAIAKSLDGTAATVAVLEMPGEQVKDLSDWVEEKRRTGKEEAEIRSLLERLSTEAPAWSPDEAGEPTSEEQEKKPKPTQAQRLMGLASTVRLFHSPEEVAFASVRVGEHEETWPIRSRSFRRWLMRQFYAESGSPPNAQALKDTLDLLAAKAQFDGDELPTFTRIAGQGDKIYLDLGDPNWRSVEISADGWKVESSCPVKFTRTKGMRPLPSPRPSGSILDLHKLINVPDESDFQLVVAWLLAALRPVGPFPILVLQGEQGSAKSTAARMLRSLIDPATSPIRAVPRDEHDLMIAARNAWLLAFDNLSGIKSWLSDALCRLATGGGFSTRQLYTDAEETILDAQRPVILNGIEELTSRQDLLDRALIVQLPPIQPEARRPESELWDEFDAQKPGILGALLTAVSTGLRDLPSVELASLPRMADFAKWISATEAALPWPEGFFLRAYSSNREESVDLALESDVVATALLALLDRRSNWRGTATELLAELGNQTAEGTLRSRAWPKTARALSGRLRRAAPVLRTMGAEIDFQREAGSKSRRVIQVRRSPDSCVATVATVALPVEAPKESGPKGATQKKSATQPATQLATQTESRRSPADGTCDAGDGRDANHRPSSPPPAEPTPTNSPRAQARPVAAQAGVTGQGSQSPGCNDSREVLEL